MSEHRYHVIHRGEIHTLELSLPHNVDPVEFDRLNEEIGQIGPRGLAQRWVVDLAATRYVGSALLGMLVNLRQRIKTGGGRLVLCGLSEPLQKAVRTCSLHTLFTIVSTRAEAEKSVKLIR